MLGIAVLHLTAVGKFNYNEAICILLFCLYNTVCAHQNPNMTCKPPDIYICGNWDMKVTKQWLYWDLNFYLEKQCVCVCDQHDVCVMQRSLWMWMLTETALWRRTTLKR